MPLLLSCALQQLAMVLGRRVQQVQLSTATCIHPHDVYFVALRSAMYRPGPQAHNNVNCPQQLSWSHHWLLLPSFHCCTGTAQRLQQSPCLPHWQRCLPLQLHTIPKTGN
jgi:hypothetical protein